MFRDFQCGPAFSITCKIVLFSLAKQNECAKYNVLSAQVPEYSSTLSARIPKSLSALSDQVSECLKRSGVQVPVCPSVLRVLPKCSSAQVPSE